jgi:hypothetical protein
MSPVCRRPIGRTYPAWWSGVVKVISSGIRQDYKPFKTLLSVLYIKHPPRAP